MAALHRSNITAIVQKARFYWLVVFLLNVNLSFTKVLICAEFF